MREQKGDACRKAGAEQPELIRPCHPTATPGRARRTAAPSPDPLSSSPTKTPRVWTKGKTPHNTTEDMG